MKYMVDIKFLGDFSTEVEANNEYEAFVKVEEEWRNYSLGDKVNNIEERSIYMEDENGKVTYGD